MVASDAAWLVVFNGTINYVIQNNLKARQNPRGLSQLDGYKRRLVRIKKDRLLSVAVCCASAVPGEEMALT
jgi:hypothetical protein